MKITKSQLKRIIAEELDTFLIEDMKDVAGLMSQAGAYQKPPDAMQRLMRVIKEFAPALSDEELSET